jgi:hypothetical protein
VIPRAAAVLAARHVRELYPHDDSTGVVLQAVGYRHILSAAFTEVEHALAVADVAAAAARELIVVADAYHRTVHLAPDQPEPTIARGDTERAFRAGDPDVTEALVVCSVERAELRTHVLVLPYHRADGTVRWLPVPDLGGALAEAEGLVANDLRQSLAASDGLPQGPACDEALAWLVDTLDMIGLPIELVDNDPDLQ